MPKRKSVCAGTGEAAADQGAEDFARAERSDIKSSSVGHYRSLLNI